VRLSPRDHRRKFGALIKTLRRASTDASGRPLSQTQLATRCGWGLRRQSRLELGDAQPTRAEIAALVAALPPLEALLRRAPTARISSPAVAQAVPPLVTRCSSINELPDLVRVQLTAEFLDVSVNTVRVLLRKGHLQAVRLGRLVRVTRSSIAALAQGTR
jgi:excisionase family DNA binding protein